LPVDTTVLLTESISINIRRNPVVYGDVHFKVWNVNKEQGVRDVKIEIEGYQTLSDANGDVRVFIPLAQQKSAYPIVSSVPLEHDTICPPCGPDDVVIVK
jgi:hypothetical protein